MQNFSLNDSSAESSALNSQLQILKKKAIPALIAFSIATLLLKYYG